MALQLELAIKPIIKHSFDNFVVSEHNTQAVSHVKYLIKNPENSYIYLWGEASIGKTHILQAVLEQANLSGVTATYFSFDNINTDLTFSGITSVDEINNFLESLEDFDIVCLDDIQSIAGKPHWEEGVFGFYNRIKDANKVLLIAAGCSVKSLKIDLPDLKSRLASGISYNLKSLDDHDKQMLLQIRAKERGIVLSDELAKYLITRGRRDVPGLFEMLDKLDQYSMRHKRKLSIPFAKEILRFK